jgi:hypothetical protein
MPWTVSVTGSARTAMVCAARLVLIAAAALAASKAAARR